MNVKQASKTEREFVALARQKAQHYLRAPGVTSVGVGYRQKRNKDTGEIEVTDELCIQFTVAKKLDTETLQNSNLRPLPESLDFEDGERAYIDVIERSFQTNYEVVSDSEAEHKGTELSPRKWRRTRVDPVAPGASVSHRDGTAGTIGAIVYDNQTGTPFLLSNWHVFHEGNDLDSSEIVQPGPIDNSDIKSNRIGCRVRSHLGLAGDCAIATIENRQFTEEILELSIIPKRAAKVGLGDTVVKSGRTTGVTYGVVTRVGVTANIHYSAVGIRKIGCFEIRPNPGKLPVGGEISQGGDSGSIWMIDGTDSEGDIAVGLHFAGEMDPAPSSEHALACNIHSVLEKLDVSLVDTKSATVTEEELLNGVLARLDLLERQMIASNQSMTIPGKEIRAAPEDGIHVYGNWCGPGHGSGEPIDDVDRACMEHDKCYAQEGYFDCSCDSRLLGDLNRALASGRLSQEGRAAAIALSAWFSVQPCVNRIGGIPIPGGLGRFPLGLGQGIRRVRKAGEGLWKIVRSIF